MATYSHSRISTFEQCKLKFKYKYIDKIETDIKTSIEAFMGDMVHRTLEKLYKDLKFEKLNSKEDLFEFFERVWKDNWSDEVIIVREGLTQDNYKKMGLKFISEYYNHYKPFDDMKVLGLETMNLLELPDGSKYHVRIDRLGCKDNTYFVVDYKTNSSMKDQEEADNDRQLAMYSIWVKKKFNDADKVILRWHMLAFDKEVNSQRTEEQLQELVDETIARIKEIETCKEFPAKTSALCNWCEFKKICPQWRHLYELESKKDYQDDDGLKLVDKYSELKNQEKEVSEKIDTLKKELIAFGEQKNITRVFGKDYKASIWSKECEKFPKTTDFNYQEFVELVKRLGLWNEFSRLDVFKLEKSYEKKEFFEEIIEALRQFVKKEKVERIYLSKK